MPKIDYEFEWHNEIAHRWVKDFIIDDHFFDEISASVEEPDGDADNPADNIIFEIEFDNKAVRLYVFCDQATGEIVEVESLGYEHMDTKALAKKIYEIDQRWQKELALRILKYP